MDNFPTYYGILSRAVARALHELDTNNCAAARTALEQGREMAEAAFLADAVGYNDPEVARAIRDEILNIPNSIIP